VIALLDGWLGPGLSRLLQLRVRAALRTARRRLRTPGGVVVLLFIGLFWVMAAAAHALDEPLRPVRADVFEGIGPAVLAVTWAAMVTLRGGGEQIGFTPAEVDQLFAAPHRPEALMRYKIVLVVITWVVAGVVFGPLGSLYTRHPVSGLLVAWLLFPALQLSSMVFGLVLDLRSPPAARYLVGMLLLGLVVLSLGIVPDGTLGIVAALEAIVRHPVGQVVLLPFTAATTLFVSSHPGELLRAVAILLASNATLIGIVLALGQRAWLERAAEGAERRATLARQVRSGGIGATGSVWRLAVPRPPVLGGLGPIAWRRLVELVRRPMSLLGFAWPLGAAIGLSVVLTTVGESDPDLIAYAALGSLLWSLFVIPSSLRHDFRSDLDRMDQLLALPVPAIAVVLGQILPMAGMLTLSGWAVIGGVAAWRPEIAQWCAVAAVGLPLAILQTIAIENLLFLLLPVRIETGEAALQSVGRNLFGTFASYAINATALVASGAVAAALVWLTDDLVVGVATGAAMVAGVTLVVLLLAAWRFRRFDPSRDVPG